MTRWFVSTPFAECMIEADGGVVATAPRLIADLLGLTIDKAREVCTSRGWGFEAA